MKLLIALFLLTSTFAFSASECPLPQLKRKGKEVCTVGNEGCDLSMDEFMFYLNGSDYCWIKFQEKAPCVISIEELEDQLMGQCGPAVESM